MIGDSAMIMNYLFSYRIINEKLGFPLNSLDKVSDLLNKIKYLIKKDFSNYLKIKDFVF